MNSVNVILPFAVATVIETLGSSSAKTGSKALIDENGAILVGWIGGGCAESAVRQTAVECLNSNETTIIDIDLNEEILGVGMPCGGSMKVFIEPIKPKATLWILGHGAITETLCRLGDLIGLRVAVNDVGANLTNYPDAAEVVTDDPDYAELTPAKDDFAVVATQHKGDHQSMKILLHSNVGYIALVASRKRSGLVLDYLKNEGFAANALSRVRAPAGLDLGAQNPEEVALSIAAEILMRRRNGSGQSKSQIQGGPE